MDPFTIKSTDLYDIQNVSEESLKTIIESSPKYIKDIYNKIEIISEKLKGIGWIVDIIALPLSENGIYWSDYAGDYLEEKHGNNYYNQTALYFTFYLNKDGKTINTNKDIIINFTEMKKDMKIQVLTIFYDELPENYDWSGSNNESMAIYLNKNMNLNKPDFNKLKNDDQFPQLNLYIDIYCKELDDIPKLGLYKELLEFKDSGPDRRYDFTYNYSDGRIEIEINGIDDDDVYTLYSQIESLVKYKYQSKDLKKNERVKRYHASFYSDENTVYILEKNKLMIKNKNHLTFTDFQKKYKNI